MIMKALAPPARERSIGFRSGCADHNGSAGVASLVSRCLPRYGLAKACSVIFTIVHNTWLAGVGTPSAVPRRTT